MHDFDLSRQVDFFNHPGLKEAKLQVDGIGPLTVYEIEGLTYPVEDNGWGQIGRKGLWQVLHDHPDPNSVVEYGVGTAAALVLAAQDQRVKNLLGCDLDPEIVKMAGFNLQQAGIVGSRRVSLFISHAETLAEDLSTRGKKVDVVYFCLPQVSWIQSSAPTVRQESDYYLPERYPLYQEWGLGLVASALSHSREILTENGKVVAVLSGRIPDNIKQAMIGEMGYWSKEVTSCLVLQDPATSLETLLAVPAVQLWEKGDSGEVEPISVEEAVRRQQEANGQPANIWHTVGAWEMGLK